MPSTSRSCPLPAIVLTVICAGLWTFLAQYDASILLSANVLIIGLAGLILSLLQCCCKRTGRQYGHIDRIKTVIERYIHCLVHEKSRLGSNVICIAVIDGCGIIKSLGRNPDYAGPVPGLITGFPGTKHYHDDMPQIDVLIISHYHYNHLDYRTLKKLKNRIKMAVVPMGVGSDLVF
ncbi:hypothetical protein ABIC84_000860 [Mucilaginibacter sp. 3215]